MQRLNGMTFRQLRALQAVSETGTITQAAEILNLTPPAAVSYTHLTLPTKRIV